jgi:hypothetical protein
MGLAARLDGRTGLRSNDLPSTCPATSRAWAVEPLKLPDADDAVIGSLTQAASLPRRGLDTVWEREPAARPECFEAACERRGAEPSWL